MAFTVEAVYENGTLKLKEPLPFTEHESVLVTVERTERRADGATVPTVGLGSRNGLPVFLVPPGTPAIDLEAVRRYLQEVPFRFPCPMSTYF